MKIINVAREKLVTKDIEWKEVYTEKTQFLKEQYNDVIGPGSYYRFEGKDRGDGDEYYCIIGPAKVHQPKAKWFAGVRKLPATFSAGGKYFDSMDTAARYARETWGVPTPKTLKPYTSSPLVGISTKIDEWKAKREDEEAGQEGGYNDKKDDKDTEKESTSFSEEFKIAKADLIDSLKKEASNGKIDLVESLKKEAAEIPGHTPRTKRLPIRRFNVNSMIDPQTGQANPASPEYQEFVSSVSKDPYFEAKRPTPEQVEQKRVSAERMIQKAINEKVQKAGEISEFYGIPEAEATKMENVFIGYRPGYERDSGVVITGVGPYVSVGERHGSGNVRRDAWGKFNVHHLKKRNASANDILATVDERINRDNERFGLSGTPNELTRSDYGYTVGGYGDDPKNRMRISSLGPENQAEMDSLFTIAPIEGDGALMSVNDGGQGKIIKSKAEQEGISLEEAINLYSDEIKWDTLTGAQNFTESKRDDTLARDLEVVQDVLGALPSNFRLTGNNVKEKRDLIHQYMGQKRPDLSDRVVDEAISQVIQMQKPTKTSPALNSFELYVKNQDAINAGLDSTNFNTEDEALAKANVDQDLLEERFYEEEYMPDGRPYDPAVSQQLRSEKLQILRTVRMLEEVRSTYPEFSDLEFPAVSDEQKSSLIQMSNRAFNANRHKFDVYMDLANEPRIAELVKGPGVEGVHKEDRTGPALEGVNDVVTDPAAFVDDVRTDIGGIPEEQEAGGDIQHYDRPIGNKKPKNVTTPGYLSQQQKMELQKQKQDEEARKNVRDPWGPEASSNNLKEVYASTLSNLIGIARNMDNEGKPSVAKELHGIIRTYQERAKNDL